MRKIILILIILLSFSCVYADDLVEEYIEIIETETFGVEQLEMFNTSYDHEALSLFLSAHVALQDYDYKTAYADLETAYEITESDLLKTRILYYLAMIDLEFSNTSSYIKRGLQLKNLAHEIEDLKGIIHADRLISIGYYYTYDYDEARQYAEEGMNLAKSINYPLGIWEYYTFIGHLQIIDDKNDEAIASFEKAKEYSEEHEINSVFYDVAIENEKKLAAGMYWRNRRDKAVDYLLPLLDQVPENNPFLKAQIYNLLGQYSFTFTDAQIYYELALDYYDQVSKGEDYGSFKSSVHENLAANYYVAGEYREAADYYHLVLRYQISDEYYENKVEKFEDLEAYKYDEFNEKIQLLEELAETKTNQLATQKRFIYIFFASAVMLFVFTVVTLLILKSRSKSRKELYVSSITDNLTMVSNRSHIIELFESKLEGDNAVILIDLDDFKGVNDQFGHAVGDQVLRSTADVLKHSVRGQDVVGRYGGDRFLVVLDKASQDECRIVAERIRLNIEACEWPYDGLNTTCSVGVTRIFSTDSDEVLLYVDSLLNQAKSNGKNQVVYG